MASLRFLFATPVLLSILGACSIEPDNWHNSNGTYAEPSDNGGANGVTQGNVAGSKSGARAGAPARNEDQDVQPADKGRQPVGINSGGSAGASEEEELPKSCELGSSCTSKCEDTTVTCGFVSTGHACEFEGFIGATAEVSCGQRVVVGTACCGGCGCVPVELYFDGKHCWQGLPQCSLDNFTDQVFAPHPTTTPNPNFVPPPSFYLGSGGIGGKPEAGDGGGLSFGGGLGSDPEAGGGGGRDGGGGRNGGGGGPDGAGGLDSAGAGGESGAAAEPSAGAPNTTAAY